MTFQLTLPTLLGVIIGGVVFILCLAVALVVPCLQIKHRRLLAQTNAAGNRRLSQYPGGHLSITDEDVAQIPGTGAAMREFLGNRYPRASDYTPMALRETIDHPAVTRKLPTTVIPGPNTLPKAVSKRGETPATVSPNGPWPMPRRLKRANRPPMMDIQLSTISPIAEARRGEDSQLNEQSRSRGIKMMSQQKHPGDPGSSRTYNSEGFSAASSDLIAVPIPILKPKPLFHEKPRSISHGMISQLSESRKPAGGRYLFESQGRFASRSPRPRPRMPRSISLTSQEPGMAPSGPIPLLPAEAVVFRRQRSIRASNSRQSQVASNSSQSERGALYSNSTTVARGGNSMTSLPPEKNAGSIKLIPLPSAEGFQKNGDPFKDDCSMMDETMDEPPVSPTVARTRTLKAHPDSRKSFRASIQDSIPRSNSSGLSESLLNHGWSRSASNASMVREICNAPTRSKPLRGCGIGAHISVFDFGLSTSLDLLDVSHSQVDLDDVQNTRRSMPVLQVISGNKQSPATHPYNGRPSSIATEHPLRLDIDLLPKEPVARKESANERGFGRQNCLRMSIVSHPLLPQAPANPPVISKKDGMAKPAQARNIHQPRIDPPTSRPSSRLTFDQQLTPTPPSKVAAARSPYPKPYFRTLAKLTSYEDSDSSPGSILSTPTRKPGQKKRGRASGTHQNRQRAIFDNPSSKIVQSSLAGQHPALCLGLRGTSESSEIANIFRLDAQLNPPTLAKDNGEDDGNDKSISRPRSLLYRFPSPPSPLRVLNLPSWREPQSQPMIQSPPPPPTPPPRSPYRPSLHKPRPVPISSPKRINASGNSSPGAQLRASVIALRRMNSEIGEAGKAGREHKRYLSLGDGGGGSGRESAISEDGGGGEVVFGGGDNDGVRVRRPSEPRGVPVAAGNGVMERGTAASGPRVEGDRTEDRVKDMERGRRNTLVRGPRAMPGWRDECMVASPILTPTPREGGRGDGYG